MKNKSSGGFPTLSMCLLVTTALRFTAGPMWAADPVHLVFSADTEGQLGRCPSCPGDPNQGGLPRRASLVSALREQPRPMLLVDAGNALFGRDTLATGPGIIIAAYDAMGYDVLNLSYADFRAGKEVTLAAFRGARLSPVSANLLDAATGLPLFARYVVKDAGGVKVAIIGVTEVPASIADLPHLKRELAGIQIESAETALVAVLPQARREAQLVVLLYHGSAASLGPLRKHFGREVSAILAGGPAPGELPTEGTAGLFTVPGAGRALVDVSLGGGTAPTAVQHDVDSSLPPQAEVQALVDHYADQEERLLPLSVVAEASPPATAAPGGAARPAAAVAPTAPLEPGVTRKLSLAGQNAALELRVNSVALLDRFGATPAPPGQRWLVIATTWTNLQMPQMVSGQPVPVPYQGPELSAGLYAVADERRVLRRAEIDAPRLLPTGGLSIAGQGDSTSGVLVYGVPQDSSPRQLTLRFYDEQNGNIVLPVLAGEAPSAEKPLGTAVRNEIVEAAVYDFRTLDQSNGVRAGEGSRYVQVDFRARSLRLQESVAERSRPGVRKGQKRRVGTVADWRDSRKYLQLVADGVYTCAPEEASEWPAEPRFLPDVPTGGRLVFRVPGDARALELRCDFPNANPADGKAIPPRGLTLALEGKRGPVPASKTLAQLDDPIFKVAVVGVGSPDSFVSKKPPPGRRWVVMDISVQNVARSGEFFQTQADLKYTCENGETVEIAPGTYEAVHRPAPVLWIPAGERRRFQIACCVPAKERRPRLTYSGGTPGKTVELPELPE